MCIFINVSAGACIKDTRAEDRVLNIHIYPALYTIILITPLIDGFFNYRVSLSLICLNIFPYS